MIEAAELKLAIPFIEKTEQVANWLHQLYCSFPTNPEEKPLSTHFENLKLLFISIHSGTEMSCLLANKSKTKTIIWPTFQAEPSTQAGPSSQAGPSCQTGPSSQTGPPSQTGPSSQAGLSTQAGPSCQAAPSCWAGLSTQVGPPSQARPSWQAGPSTQASAPSQVKSRSAAIKAASTPNGSVIVSYLFFG